MKKEILIKSAKELFVKYGFKKVSVEEICQNAKISKMTFYKHFKNKEIIAFEVIKVITSEFETKRDMIFNLNEAIEIKFQKFIELKLLAQENYNEDFLNEIMQKSEITRSYLTQKKNEGLQIFINLLQNSKEKGELREDVNPEFFLYLVNKVEEIYYDSKLDSVFSSRKERLQKIMEFLFYGLLSR